jgi:hypothetical protein
MEVTMKRVHSGAWLIGLVSLLVLTSSRSLGQAKPGLPRAEEIIQKALERTTWAEAQDFENKYAYTQWTASEKLDGQGTVKERRERFYHVFPINGVAYARLVQKDGKPLSPEELKKEQEREREFREKLARNERHSADNDDEITFNEELVSRYQFETVGQELINGRPTYVLTFKPNGGTLPEKRKTDRLLNKLAGKIWIDQQEYEIAKVEADLLEEVKLWGGVLASVKQFQFRLEQVRVDEGVWLQSRFDGYLDGRYLLSSVRMKWAEQWSHFRKAAPEVGAVSGGRP